MAQVDSFVPHSFAGLHDEWSPRERVRLWLLVGIAALVIDLVLSSIAAALEMKHWGQPGLTPDVLLEYIAILPEALVFAAYLALAHDAGARGLWKSAAGLFGSYLLLALLSLVLLEVVQGGAVGVTIAAAIIGAVGLSIFTFSKFPRFEDRGRSAVGEMLADQNEPAASAANSIEEDEKLVDAASKAGEDSESGVGCWIHIALGIGLFALKGLARGRNKWLGNLGGDVWTMIALAILAVFAIGYAAWFATAKIRSSDRLGGLAALTGFTELAILLLHVAMFASLLVVVISAVGDPQFDEDKFDEWLDPWLKRGSLVSTACHALWGVVTIALFTVLRMRGEPDWRTQFLTPER